LPVEYLKENHFSLEEKKLNKVHLQVQCNDLRCKVNGIVNDDDDVMIRNCYYSCCSLQFPGFWCE